MQKRLLSLGKKLAKQFEDYNGDEICAWMAHYIAEKMTTADSAQGKEKLSAQKECFEAILLLWERQASFPRDLRPFKNFEPVFRALAHIDPKNEFPAYYDHEKFSEEPHEQLANMIVNVDAAARVMVSYLVREAVLCANDPSLSQWLGGIQGVIDSDESSVILKVLPELDLANGEEEQKKLRITELAEHIDRLDAFVRIAQNIQSDLKTKRDRLEAEKLNI
tara:strand:+ start:8153 stop:8815 length:663 start_codon:yes stop_codon:yes gene_type:complete